MSSYDRHGRPYIRSTGFQDGRIPASHSRRSRYDDQTRRPRSPSHEAVSGLEKMALGPAPSRNEVYPSTEELHKPRRKQYVAPTEDEVGRMEIDTRGEMYKLGRRFDPELRKKGLSLTEVASRVALSAAKLDGDAATGAMHARQLEEETGGFNRVSYHDSAFPPSLLPPSQPSQGLSQEKLSRYESSPEPPSKIRGILKNAGPSKQPKTVTAPRIEDDEISYKPAARFLRSSREAGRGYPALISDIDPVSKPRTLELSQPTLASSKFYRVRSRSRDRPGRIEEPHRTKERSRKHDQISKKTDRRPERETAESSIRGGESSGHRHKSSNTEDRRRERPDKRHGEPEDGSRREDRMRVSSKQDGSGRKHRRRSERHDSFPLGDTDDGRYHGEYGFVRTHSPEGFE